MSVFYGPFEAKAIPEQSMTDTEIRTQVQVVSEAAEATQFFTEDELEAYTVNLRKLRACTQD
jgi:hypothetical protein